MTSTLPARTVRTTPDAVEDAIRARLDDLKSQCAEALAQYSPPGSGGDAADRCANVELAITIEDLQARIAELELMLQSSPRVQQPRRGRNRRPAGAVEVGSRVQVSFDNGRSSETFVVLPHELALGDDEVVTPNSPLGQALQGSTPGDRVSYRAANRATITVDVIAVDGVEFTPESARSA